MPYRLRNASGDDQRVEKKASDPDNPALAENMRRLMAGRSIETVRKQMCDYSEDHPGQDLSIGTSTLHRALKGEGGIRLESLEKIATFFGTTKEALLQPSGGATQIWPFSTELQDKVLLAEPKDLHFMEVAMWSHLRLEVPTDLHFENLDERSETAPRKPSTIVPPRTPSQSRLKKSS